MKEALAVSCLVCYYSYLGWIPQNYFILYLVYIKHV